MIKHAGVAVDAKGLHIDWPNDMTLRFLDLARRESNALQPHRFVTGLEHKPLVT